MNYKEYLQSDYWKQRRLKFISKTHHRCYLCRVKDNLQVHHKRYKRNNKSILFNERHHDFRLLCGRCHNSLHKLGLMWHLNSGKIKRKVTLQLILDNEAKNSTRIKLYD